MVKKAAPEVPDINWDLITPSLIEAFTPIIQGVTWLGLTKIDPKVNALNNLIAIAEVLPTVDLNLPRGIVLAAMYDKTADSLKMLNDLAAALEGVPQDLKDYIANLLEETETAIKEKVPFAELDQSQKKQLLDDHGECKNYSKNFLPIAKDFAYAGCMLRKGWQSDVWGEL